MAPGRGSRPPGGHGVQQGLGLVGGCFVDLHLVVVGLEAGYRREIAFPALGAVGKCTEDGAEDRTGDHRIQEQPEEGRAEEEEPEEEREDQADEGSLSGAGQRGAARPVVIRPATCSTERRPRPTSTLGTSRPCGALRKVQGDRRQSRRTWQRSSFSWTPSTVGYPPTARRNSRRRHGEARRRRRLSRLRREAVSPRRVRARFGARADGRPRPAEEPVGRSVIVCASPDDDERRLGRANQPTRNAAEQHGAQRSIPAGAHH